MGELTFGTASGLSPVAATAKRLTFPDCDPVAMMRPSGWKQTCAYQKKSYKMSDNILHAILSACKTSEEILLGISSACKMSDKKRLTFPDCNPVAMMRPPGWKQTCGLKSV